MKGFLYHLATDKPVPFAKGRGKVKGLLVTFFKFFLFLLSLIYGLVVKFLIFFNRYALTRLSCKVISVGNITVGGTGKTSLVEFIARFLKNQGHTVAILSRGYKRQVRSYEGGARSYELMGDEPYMLQMKLKDIPVIVDTDRARAAHRAVKDFYADTVILDDGFQQWKIAKDLEIVTVDATCPFGNRHLLPRGLLREPLSSLERADVFVLTKTNLNSDTSAIKGELNRLSPKAAIFESVHQAAGFYDIKKPEELWDKDSLKAKTVTLFCGIGDPGSFENLMRNLGVKIGLSYKFRDHHDYTKQDLDKIVHSSRENNIDTIVTTEKDSSRISQMKVESLGLEILVLRIKLLLKDEQRFCHRLLQLYPV